ncbi:hypothetical protein VRZ08_05070 [Rhodopseudomonas sp. G2_2311]|uniref:hypothetical protein n=1 Tax=Rhodopseudomonas sp. G2_2311 TaxID=3114287 RepID=UPI0039C71562
MLSRLNAGSRLAIRRFCTKLAISAVIGTYGKAGYLTAVSFWIGLYSACCVAFALILKERFFQRDGFNHWDEALWLGFVALGLHIARNFAH